MIHRKKLGLAKVALKMTMWEIRQFTISTDTALIENQKIYYRTREECLLSTSSSKPHLEEDVVVVGNFSKIIIMC